MDKLSLWSPHSLSRRSFLKGTAGMAALASIPKPPVWLDGFLERNDQGLADFEGCLAAGAAFEQEFGFSIPLGTDLYTVLQSVHDPTPLMGDFRKLATLRRPDWGVALKDQFALTPDDEQDFIRGLIEQNRLVISPHLPAENKAAAQKSLFATAYAFPALFDAYDADFEFKPQSERNEQDCNGSWQHSAACTDGEEYIQVYENIANIDTLSQLLAHELNHRFLFPLSHPAVIPYLDKQAYADFYTGQVGLLSTFLHSYLSSDVAIPIESWMANLAYFREFPEIVSRLGLETVSTDTFNQSAKQVLRNLTDTNRSGDRAYNQEVARQLVSLLEHYLLSPHIAHIFFDTSSSQNDPLVQLTDENTKLWYSLVARQDNSFVAFQNDTIPIIITQDYTSSG